ncbi:MAG: hypothetical protein JXB47_06860 [Anaerolineae bacterium]|nr:hypothetical protein [Anaerolineae bacterium]
MQPQTVTWQRSTWLRRCPAFRVEVYRDEGGYYAEIVWDGDGAFILQTPVAATAHDAEQMAWESIADAHELA